MNFGQAIEALKLGLKVARKGWNGKGMYLWLLPAASVKKEWIKDKMLLSVFGERNELMCLGSIRMLTATGEVLTGWLASQTDMLAEDWEIVVTENVSFDGFPRRNWLEKNEAGELSIHFAIQEVEKMGADERLTKAVILLAEAKNLVADFVDNKQ